MPQTNEEDEEADPTKYYETRSKLVANMKANKQDPYPHKFHVSTSIHHFVEQVCFVEIYLSELYLVRKPPVG